MHGDVRDESAWERALESVDVVFHQAAYQDYMTDYSTFFQTNVVGTALLFEVIRRRHLGIRKVIVASSQAVYGEGQYECAKHGVVLPSARSNEQMRKGDWEVHCPQCGETVQPLLLREDYPNPFNPYALSKLSQELAALRLGLGVGVPTVALRYSVTQGPRQSLLNQYSGILRIFLSRIKSGLPVIVYEDGRQTRDFVHVKDVVDANLLVLESDSANIKPTTLAVACVRPFSSSLIGSPADYRRTLNFVYQEISEWVTTGTVFRALSAWRSWVLRRSAVFRRSWMIFWRGWMKLAISLPMFRMLTRKCAIEV